MKAIGHSFFPGPRGGNRRPLDSRPMSGSEPPPRATAAGRLLRAPVPLLETTMDQLRTLAVVHRTGTALGAARLLGREQSSVQKQLDTLNRNYSAVCGEPLTAKQGRGRDLLFTATGEALAALAGRTLGDWLDELHRCRRRLGGTVAVATTQLTLGYFSTAAERVAEEFERRGVELKVAHVRTGELLDSLRNGDADLVCGSVAASPAGGGDGLGGFEVMEWRRSGLCLLSNLPAHRLPERAPGPRMLRSLPLVVPSTGLITDFLRGWFGADYRDRLEIAAEIDSIGYGFQLLRSGLVAGGMLVTRGIAEAVVDGRLPEGRGLRPLDLPGGPQLEVLVGAFTRRGERAGHGPAHPLNLLWNALAAEHVRWREHRRPTSAAAG